MKAPMLLPHAYQCIMAKMLHQQNVLNNTCRHVQ